MLALLICLCSTLAATSARAQTDAAAVDRTVFDVLVREAADSTWEVLLVDVRPLRQGADLTGLDPEDVDGGDSALAASRAAVLGQLGIQPTDALAERRCLFTTGVQREPRPANPARPDTLAQMRQACRQRAPFVVLMAAPGAGRVRRRGQERPCAGAAVQHVCVRILGLHAAL